jgi:hypothetical protein
MPDDQGKTLGLTLCAAVAVFQSWMFNAQGNMMAYELTWSDDEEYYDDDEEDEEKL